MVFLKELFENVDFEKKQTTKKIKNYPVNSLIRPDKLSGLIRIKKMFDTLIVFLKEFFKKVDYEKKQTTKKNTKITQ